MGDYQCRYCQDRGCIQCDWAFADEGSVAMIASKLYHADNGTQDRDYYYSVARTVTAAQSAPRTTIPEPQPKKSKRPKASSMSHQEVQQNALDVALWVAKYRYQNNDGSRTHMATGEQIANIFKAIAAGTTKNLVAANEQVWVADEAIKKLAVIDHAQ